MKTGYVLTFCAALIVGGVFVAGSALAEDKVTEKTPITDTWLTAKTKIALAADGRVKGRQIDVKTKQGVVMLRGKVDSTEAKQAAADITTSAHASWTTWFVPGVKSVKNDLTVKEKT